MPKSKINEMLKKVAEGTPKANSPSTFETVKPTLGDPNCPYCHGVGYVRYDVPLDDPRFGKVEACICRAAEIAEGARRRLFELSRLDRLGHLTFENFNPRGNPQAEKIMTPQDFISLQTAKETAEAFANRPEGWLLLEGGYGCGKTHLAAAIANRAVYNGIPTLFITVPDLLDNLRFAYNDPDTTFEARFEEVRNARLLVLDDFGTQNATPWAQEKLFQILNYRYINKLPTVITTNLMLDEIESRIRSRLQDESFVRRVQITAPDYRHPTQPSTPGISMLAWPEVRSMTFKNFETREDEVGKEVVTTIITERKDSFGNKVKEKEIRRITVTAEDLKSLHRAYHAAVSFSEEPRGWLVLLGGSFCGKTHLAAAIGNYRIDLGGQAIMVAVNDLLDYLRQTFNPRSDVSFDRRFHEVKNTPLLILDDLKESGVSSLWAEDKLLQILNYRYYADLPTVITSTLTPDDFALNYPGLWNKVLDTTKSQVYVIDMPPYRRIGKGKGGGHRKSK
ncbi:MAG: ATP-binding protein [Anaerolineales bacterium]|nr:ATP-binding protein [Anaerolineales bacterium]MCX7609348.1 ATP-binding protein [Anaerolineales bacterium]MDW8226430.1 ATP-binding protein [Anaerolineales bacterium]